MTFKSPFTATPAKRLPARGRQEPMEQGELQKRWKGLADTLKQMRPSWRWSSLETLSSGRTTTARMH
eukprot:118927-Pyramimonas_sp.AAC.1